MSRADNDTDVKLKDIDRGVDWQEAFKVFDEDSGSFVSFNGRTFKCQLKKERRLEAPVIVTPTVNLSIDNDMVLLTLSRQQTASLEEGVYYYSIIIEDNGFADVFMKGTVYVAEGVTSL